MITCSFVMDRKAYISPEQNARITFASIDKIPCTSCGYCVPGCPMEIRIPNIFRVMNTYKVYGQLAVAKREYNFARGSSSASDCIGCAQCEGACPQHLPIIDLLAEVAEVLEA